MPGSGPQRRPGAHGRLARRMSRRAAQGSPPPARTRTRTQRRRSTWQCVYIAPTHPLHQLCKRFLHALPRLCAALEEEAAVRARERHALRARHRAL
jgi:hypothetical protein